MLSNTHLFLPTTFGLVFTVITLVFVNLFQKSIYLNIKAKS